MSRSSTTALYTRVDNSFSNPVIGTTISPTDADTFFDDVEASMNSFIATSTTSLAIGTGTKTFTVASAIATKAFLANTHIHAFSLSNTANYMDCTVTSYDAGTGALVTDCFAVGGSGTITDWVIISAGARGATGATGTTGTSGAGYGGTSATSFLIGTGSKAFTTTAGLAYQVGNYVRASSQANGANFMEGLVTAYSGTTLTINITKVGGAGTLADWAFAVSGVPGAGDMLSTNNLSDLASAATARTNLALVPDTNIPSQTSFNAAVARDNSTLHLFLA